MDIELLKNIPLFSQLSREDIATLRELLVRKEVPAHQTVCWIGENGTEMSILQSGKVDVVQPDERGKEIVLSQIGPGGFFGELSLLDGGPRTATVRTAAPCVLLNLDRRAFQHFLEKHPGAAVHVLTELAARMRNMMQMLRSVKNINEEIAVRQTFAQRFADSIAKGMGSWKFIIGQTCIYVCWIIVNVILRGRPEDWDPYPFNLLSLVLTAVAGYAAPIIMMSQSRQAEKDRIKAELEYQVNVKAHVEVMALHQKIDALTEMLRPPQAAGSDPVARLS
jgi:uncharacterized membrane protein